MVCEYNNFFGLKSATYPPPNVFHLFSLSNRPFHNLSPSISHTSYFSFLFFNPFVFEEKNGHYVQHPYAEKGHP